jgi:hypothetical protein
VTLHLPAGVHVYGDPAADGLTPLQVTIAPFDGLELEPVQLPTPRLLQMEGPAETFPIHEGTIEALVPFAIIPYQETVTLAVQIRYQACTDAACYPPDSASCELTLKGADLIRE